MTSGPVGVALVEIFSLDETNASQVRKRWIGFIGINVDKDPALALKFIQQYQPNFEIRSDQQGKLASQFKVPGMPSTFILRRDGQPAAKHQKGFFKAKRSRV